MGRIEFVKGREFSAACDVLIIGAGAAGLTAALAAKEQDATVIVVERDRLPRGSTSLSAGLIPAAGTTIQRAAGIADSAELFAADLRRKASNQADPVVLAAIVGAIAPALDWLGKRHHLPFSIVDNFVYPGHSTRRMHGLPSRSGGELMDHLIAAATQADIHIHCDATAETLFVGPDKTIRGVGLHRPDGTREEIGCTRLILACNGYGGSRERIARHIPEMATARYFGHAGNRGDALDWGEALGAATRHLSAYQGHGSVAEPHGILITWATISEGGFQVNSRGKRFSDESRGYSEQAETVLAQPGSLVWTIFDERIAGVARQFEDFRAAEAAGAIITAPDVHSLAAQGRLPSAALTATLHQVSALQHGGETDSFGRSWKGVGGLVPPYKAVRVTGALFHTQGGLVVDRNARVLKPDGVAIPGLYAAGGAAAGLSGNQASGYLSGNGLLSAVALGFIAGRHAAGT